MRLIHNKNAFCFGYDQYTWNEVPKSHDVKEKADAIKAEGLWQEVRDRYVGLKNMYFSRQDNTHPSFIVYVEAVNEIYYKYFRYDEPPAHGKDVNDELKIRVGLMRERKERERT